MSPSSSRTKRIGGTAGASIPTGLENMISAGATSVLFDEGGISVLELCASETMNDDDNGVVLILLLDRRNEKNVINPTSTSLISAALDAVEAHPSSNKSLVITAASKPALTTGAGGAKSTSPDSTFGKFLSNGLDLEYLLSHPPSDVATLIQTFCKDVLARILVLPCRTVAAINGHAIGAGLFLSLACDYRVMRTQRGFLQWPEANLAMRLSKGFAELSKAKVASPSVLAEGVLTAKKYTSGEALERGLIDKECPLEKLLECAVQLAREGLPETSLGLQNFDSAAYREIKIELYTDAYRALVFGKVGDLPHSRL